MPTYAETQKVLAAALLASMEGVTTVGDLSSFASLLDALPPYESAAFEAIHRGALAELLETNLPNAVIEPEPPESGIGYANTFTYTGSCSGYQNAFFGSVRAGEIATAIAADVAAVDGKLGGIWWGSYGVAALSDAIRSTISVSIETSKIQADLAELNKALRPALAASVLATLRTGYEPTRNALASIAAAGQTEAVRTSLAHAIGQGQFTTNVNQAIGQGGDSAAGAVWFLSMLWLCLRALGAPDVDALIRQAMAQGLEVPPQVSPESWWNGGYTSWHTPLSGADVLGQARATIAMEMPQKKHFVNAVGPQFPDQDVSTPNGYARSFCLWGSLNQFIPSCFGVGTGVLMADGSVRPIEAVQQDDVVQTSLGPKRVVLVESPRRGGRPLYRLDGLDLRTTVAHPFRAAAGGPARVAMDPWALIDNVPTTIAGGVGALLPGVHLAGADRSGPKDVTVTGVTVCTAEPEQDEQVYDLILEHWWKDHPSYYVGGPDVFVAADPETVDPLHDVPCTAAVVVAMETALVACREHVSDPARGLSAHVALVPLAKFAHKAVEAARRKTEDEPRLPSIPGPEFYCRDGAWDAHASALEAHLVRHHARRLRREIRTGWRTRGTTGTRAVLLVHDVELLGDAAVPAGAAAEIALAMRPSTKGPPSTSGAPTAKFLQRPVDGWDLVKRTLPIEASAVPRWHLLVDRTVVFDEQEPESWKGALLVEGSVIACFRAAIAPPAHGAAEEHFLFDPHGAVVGRIAIEQRRLSVADLAVEEQWAAQWSRRQAFACAIELGLEVGRTLVDGVTRRRGR